MYGECASSTFFGDSEEYGENMTLENVLKKMLDVKRVRLGLCYSPLLVLRICSITTDGVRFEHLRSDSAAFAETMYTWDMLCSEVGALPWTRRERAFVHNVYNFFVCAELRFAALKPNAVQLPTANELMRERDMRIPQDWLEATMPLILDELRKKQMHMVKIAANDAAKNEKEAMIESLFTEEKDYNLSTVHESLVITLKMEKK